MRWLALQAPANAGSADSTDNADSAGGAGNVDSDGTAFGAGLSDPHSALAWWALQFSPMLASVEGSLVLEVSASERLFGGPEVLLERLVGMGPVLPWRYAQGSSSRVALGRLWCAAEPGRAADTPPDRLPLSTLQAAQKHLPTLERLGCRCWGDLRALPRGGLARRFGATLLEALDCAYGQRAEVYPWLTLPDVFEARLELSAAVESAPALLFGARRLLAQLQIWLRARQRGVLVLEFGWELDARRSNALHKDDHHDGDGQGRLVLHTAQATQDVAHLQRLLGELLNRVTLPAPVLYVRLRSLQTQALSGETHSLLPDEVRTGDRLHQMLERVGSRLGPAQVLCVQTQADHVPERMQRWVPWTANRSATAPLTQPRLSGGLHPAAVLYPTWMAETPVPLSMREGAPYFRGTLHLVAGPQRLEGGWLHGPPVLRDYYIARSPKAGLVWVFRERLAEGARWYLHGWFS